MSPAAPAAPASAPAALSLSALRTDLQVCVQVAEVQSLRAFCSHCTSACSLVSSWASSARDSVSMCAVVCAIELERLGGDRAVEQLCGTTVCGICMWQSERDCTGFVAQCGRGWEGGHSVAGACSLGIQCGRGCELDQWRKPHSVHAHNAALLQCGICVRGTCVCYAHQVVYLLTMATRRAGGMAVCPAACSTLLTTAVCRAVCPTSAVPSRWYGSVPSRRYAEQSALLLLTTAVSWAGGMSYHLFFKCVASPVKRAGQSVRGEVAHVAW